MGKVKKRGHCCKICGNYKSNEGFSGKGHVTHICKACAMLSVSKRNEIVQMRELEKVYSNFSISKADLELLKKRAKTAKYPNVQALANDILDIHMQNNNFKEPSMNTTNECTSVDFNTEVVNNVIFSISIKNIEASVKAFLEFIRDNKSQKVRLCRMLADEVFKFTQVHHINNVFKSVNKNIIILSEEQSPLYLLRTYIAGIKQVGTILAKLTEFVKHCEEFVEPTDKSISIEEIDLVIETAQIKYNMLNIIAPIYPLVVMRLKSTNIRWNSQCGVMGEGSETRAVLLIYHPRIREGNDPVYIFAHEIGHAFHLSLTHDIEIMPSKFDEMNDILGVKKDIPNSDKAEMFADVVAMAILNCPELKNHDPFTMLEHLVPSFDRYISLLSRGQI